MTPAQFNGLLAALGAAPGVLLPSAGTAAPNGFLLCDGSAVSRTTYAGLFAAISTIWGAGNGTTTFNLPDLRGRFPVGAGQGAGLSNYTIGNTGGAESQALARANLPSLSLDIVVDKANPAVGGNAAVQGSNAAATPDTVPAVVPTGGVATPVPTLPPYAAVNWFIKT